MRKSLILALFLTGSAFGLSDSQIVGIYESAKEQGLSVSVESRQKIEGTKYEEIKIKISDGSRAEYMAVYSDGEYVFPDIIDVKGGFSHLARFEKAQEKIQMQGAYKELGKLIKSMDKAKIIAIGSDKNKGDRYIFTDPDCPYCRQELKNIDAQLQTANLKLILAPISTHGLPAIKKSIAILEEVKVAKNDAQKIEILKKYFDPKVSEPKVKEAQISAFEASVEKIFATGAVRGVPAIFEASDLGL